MLDTLKEFFWSTLSTQTANNTAKGGAMAGGTLSGGALLTSDNIIAVVGLSIAFLSLAVSVVSTVINKARQKVDIQRVAEAKRANDLKERELDMQESKLSGDVSESLGDK